jgi:hypothetical protein
LFCSIFFYRVFGRFVTRGVQKRDKKKIARKSPQLPKKVLTYLRHFFFFFRGPPCPGSRFQVQVGRLPGHKGRRRRGKKRSKVTCICCSAKKKVVTYQGALEKKEKNAHGGGWVLFLGISGPEKHLFVFRFYQDAPPQMTQRTSWLCLCVVGQETPEVSYPTDLSNGYKTGPEYRKTASARGMWNRQQMAQYGSSARYICLGGVLESCPGVNDYSGFHFCWSLRSKPSRSTDIPFPPPRSPTRSYSRYPLLRHSNDGHNLGSSGRLSVFFRAAWVWVMEWSRKSYTRSHWLPGTRYGTNRAHGHLLHLSAYAHRHV